MIAGSVGRYDSFLIRVLSRDGYVIQGEITHVATRDRIRFRNAQRMIEFISAHLNESSVPPPGWDPPAELE